MRHLKYQLVLLPLLLAVVGCANDSTPVNLQAAQVESSELAAVQTPDYERYDRVLKAYVNESGEVDYEALQANRDDLDKFNASLAAIPQETYSSWSADEQMAFWINAYNSFTLQAIIEEEPLKDSIRDIPGVWKRKTFAIAGEAKTLDQIEHDILRPQYNEPLIHMGIVCASVGCPILRQEPFVAENLDTQLDEQTRQYLSSPYGLQIDREDNTVYISKIFDWFGKDWLPQFEVDDDRFAGNKTQRAVLNFISNYVSDSDRDYLLAGDYKVRYIDYDWSLNRQ